MIKILFICHGNICRSPMAEIIFKNMIQQKNLADQFFVSSAATSSEEIWNGVGNPVYPPAKAELAKHGLSCGDKHAVLLKREDYEKYDYLIGMDSANIRNMKRILVGDPKGKIYKLLSFAGSDRDVADPWYTGKFDVTYRDIEIGCKELLAFLLTKQYD
ncbi:MAG: low molecular weight phosphotyrosine protein phosphatase [Clostridium sp.]|nr:low molecular weight phosphotyrosine protein phosphatase [Clostridium sp.]MCM1207734.1 low molecular weight phosphotyrosine protein phosphatase [Ruminococcus sp.]